MSAIRELHDRLESTMTTVLLWLGVVVFLPLAGGMLAGGSQLPTGRLFTDAFLWSAALVCQSRLARVEPIDSPAAVATTESTPT